MRHRYAAVVLRVGLTGGIGSGKSAVAALLAERGAVVVDADRIAREVVEPGTPGLRQIADRFGPDILSGDGALNRPALGAIVFADTAARRDLERITHPLIAARTIELIERAGLEAVVIHDQPLLVEMGLAAMNHLNVVVSAPADVRVARIVHNRGMSEADARARIEAQADDGARQAVADVWLDNDATHACLADQVRDLWRDRLAPFDTNLCANNPVRRDTSVPLVLKECHPEWVAQAARISARLRYQLDLAQLPYTGIDHIGSTAVPGLIAKDVIDLQLRVPRLPRLDPPGGAFAKALRAAGVVGLRPLQDHPHLWAPDPADWQKIYAGGADPAVVLQLHVREERSPAAEAALFFRDWMRAVPAERAAYAAFKTSVARRYSSADYPEAKDPWFAVAFPRAHDWAQSTGWSAPRHSGESSEQMA